MIHVRMSHERMSYERVSHEKVNHDLEKKLKPNKDLLKTRDEEIRILKSFVEDKN